MSAATTVRGGGSESDERGRSCSQPLLESIQVFRASVVPGQSVDLLLIGKFRSGQIESAML